MYSKLFDEFLAHHNTLRVYKDKTLVFASDDERLFPLFEYINNYADTYQQVVVFDKIIGRAAALLCAKADCKEVYSPIGSELAIEALNRYGIKYHLVEIVPYIKRINEEEMCPMEKLSLDKDAEEFYQELTDRINKDK